ncbi:MAG: N-acetyltransferase [Bacteroidetes bacterium]|jgi:UDP-2-acetamido-3-amino-2,3-dideoxy-glucuronate N-acetyltransferase|nr:N-acetyltransferase [Bacteroidota bacterium]MBT7995258.1 N-acetyltransferase [Bacteroidota bacterium]
MSRLNEKNGVYIHSSSEVSDGCSIGKGTYIWNFVQIRENSIIGQNCILSKDVYIDTEVVVGNNVKIQNGVSLYNGNIIEDDVFIGPHATFTNDLQPRAFNKDWKITKTLLRKGCSIGANATIIAGNTIGTFAMVAAGSVVTSDVASFSLVKGNPARIVGFVCKIGHKMKQINSSTEKVRYYCDQCNEEISFDMDIKIIKPE